MVFLFEKYVFCCLFGMQFSAVSPTLPCPAPAALPDWLPPWSNVTVRNTSVYANCAANKPSGGETGLCWVGRLSVNFAAAVRLLPLASWLCEQHPHTC